MVSFNQTIDARISCGILIQEVTYMLTLNRRGILIMRYLLNADRSISSEVLASILGTTSKTIRGDIVLIDAILHSVGAKVTSKSGSGYVLEVMNENEFAIFVDSFNEKYNNNTPLPMYNEERIRFLIHYLLLSDSHIKSECFMDQLFISKTTLTQDFRYVRKILNEYHLTLSQKPNHGLLIEGEELHIRLALIDYLFLDEDISMIQGQQMNLTLDIKGCLDAMKYVLLKTKVHLGHKSLRDVANLIAISHYRRKMQHEVSFHELQMEELQELEEYQIAAKTYHELNIETTPSEIGFLALYIATRRIYELEDDFSLKDNKSLFFLCDEMLKFLFIYTDVNFLMDQDVRMLITKELRGFLLRINYQMEHKSLPIMEIKAMCPTFDYAMLMADYLNKKYGYAIAENEIAQLTLLLQQSISRYNLNYQKQRICLVFNRGHFSSYSIHNQLQMSLYEYIESVGSCEFHELSSDMDQQYDLIITDMPRVKFSGNIPVFQVLGSFGHDELVKVKRLLLHRSEEFALFMDGFDASLVFYELDVASKEAALDTLCEAMEQHHHISSALHQAIYAKEAISSSERGNNVSIAHSLFPICEKTTVAIGILKKPIIWDNETVQLVFVIANGNNENYVFMTSSLIQMVVQDIFAIHELLKVREFTQIRQIFYHYLVSEGI